MRSHAQPAYRLELRKTSGLRNHPQRVLVPAMSDAVYAALRDDIEARDIQDPLHITPKGVVVDGHERLRAARELKFAEVPVLVLEPDEDPVDHMLAAALLRRDLNVAQRAMLALELGVYRERRAEGVTRKRANLRHAGVDVAGAPHRGRSRDLAAKIAGVSPRTIQNAITICEKAPDLHVAARAGRLSIAQALAEIDKRANHAEIRKAPPLPNDPVELIYADPPWQSANPGSRWSPEHHYPTMPQDEIKRLPVPAAEDAVLFLWAVSALLPEAIEVMRAWGFEYRSNIVWDKLSIGLGVWVRHEHELLLIGRRGKYSPPEESLRIRSIVRARRGRHSEKPKRFYELIEQMYPHADKLELFARGKPRAGWAAWGNETEAAA
jgi:N6-adenosine-specific RNA methylase IME4/ParB-like chromosome segregation protein Spo0J